MAHSTHTHRGICPTCGRDVALKANGRLREHSPSGRKPGAASGTRFCEGGGLEPAAGR